MSQEFDPPIRTPVQVFRRARWLGITAFLALAALALLLACSPRGAAEPSPVSQPTGEIPLVETTDEACLEVVGASFQTVRSQSLGVQGNVPLVGPWIISFLTDGRVVWKTSQNAAIGEYACERGAIQATFPAGAGPAVAGQYDLAAGSLSFDGLEYVRIEGE